MLMGSGVVLLFLQRWSAPPHFVELLTHFYPQGVALWALLAVIFAISGFFIPAFRALTLARRWQNLSFLLLLLALLLPFQAYLLPSLGMSQGSVSSPMLRIVLANVLFTNSHTDAFEQWLHQQRADVVVIEELNRPYEALMQRQTDYPYHRVVYTGDPFGIGIWSRVPFVEEETLNLGPAQLPSLYVKLKTPDPLQAPLHLLATHPYPPISAAYFSDRNAQYEELAAFLTEKQGLKVVVGDLNITPWSGYYQHWTQKAGLRNSRQGQGILPSWPAHWPAVWRIPIDHVLFSESVMNKKLLSETTVGPDIGSDHFPLSVVLSGF
jgi:endonuclease/exonuclease/phosphatase (EEP) superfamily protein YafD